MKLTPELIQAVPSTQNPIKERQLDLRGESCTSPNSYEEHTQQIGPGYTIPAIENLGVTKVRVQMFVEICVN